MASETSAATWLDAFNKRWGHEDYPPIEVQPADWEQAEKDLSYTFPVPYRGAVLAVGLPRPTADLWDAIDEQSDLPHLGDFLTPTEIVESVQGWTPRVILPTSCRLRQTAGATCFRSGGAMSVTPYISGTTTSARFSRSLRHLRTF